MPNRFRKMTTQMKKGYDLRKLGVKRWRTKALVRVEWASIVREGKAKLKGP
jgi:hypothetical protein